MDEDGEKVFGEGPYRLLLETEKAGSLRQAAANMEMAYTKALRLLTRAETALGYPLLTRATGGKSGGGSQLTEEGKELLRKYEAYRTESKAANRRIYQKIFGADQ